MTWSSFLPLLTIQIWTIYVSLATIFGGRLPKFIANFSTKLKLISFGRNKIRGSIPKGIENLVNLERLDLRTNQLIGEIPISIGKLHKLNDLFVNENNLSGTIPSSLENLTSLSRFSLGSNELE